MRAVATTAVAPAGAEEDEDEEPITIALLGRLLLVVDAPAPFPPAAKDLDASTLESDLLDARESCASSSHGPDQLEASPTLRRRRGQFFARDACTHARSRTHSPELGTPSSTPAIA